MASSGTVSKLRLILGSNREVSTSPRPAREHVHVRPVSEELLRPQGQPPLAPSESPLQGWLFPDTSLLGIVDMSSTRSSAFAAVLRATRPKWLMDLRTVPRFDYDTMDRKRFFTLFDRLRILYRDVSGLAEVSSQKDASLSSGSIARIINELLGEHAPGDPPGPVLFLLENEARARLAQHVLPLLVQPQPPHGWRVCVYKAD